MSQKGLQRVKVMENAAGGRLSVREASRLLHLSERQVRRLKRRYRPDSIDWVHHGNLGRSMPWAVSSPQKRNEHELAARHRAAHGPGTRPRVPLPCRDTLDRVPSWSVLVCR
jgi:transposase